MKAVQATLSHSNLTNEQPRHHFCLVGQDSWSSSKFLASMMGQAPLLRYSDRLLLP